MVQSPDKKSLVQRLAVVDHMLTRFNKELGYQQSQMKKLQARMEVQRELQHAQYRTFAKGMHSCRHRTLNCNSTASSIKVTHCHNSSEAAMLLYNTIVPIRCSQN